MHTERWQTHKGIIILACVVSVSSPVIAQDRKSITVADAIETPRLFRSLDIVSVAPGDSGRRSVVKAESSIFLSPDRSQFAFLTIRGDLDRNGNWMEVRVGSLDSLAEAMKLRVVARLFTKAEGNGTQPRAIFPARLMFPFDNTPKWLSDNRRLAMRWVDENNIIQVITIDTQTGAIAYVTNQKSDVKEWDISGNTVLYSADAEINLSDRTRRLENQQLRGFSVSNEDLYSLLGGNIDGRNLRDIMRQGTLWVSEIDSPKPREIPLPDGADSTILKMQIAPDSKSAIITLPIAVQPNWEEYTDLNTKSLIQMVSKEPQGEKALFLRAYYVLNLVTGKLRQLYNAPANIFDLGVDRIWWSPNSHSVLITPSFLPVESDDEAGLKGLAAAVVDIETGSLRRLPMTPEAVSLSFGQWEWTDNETIISRGTDPMRFHRSDDGWRVGPHTRGAAPTTRDNTGIIVETRESENTAPAVYAFEPRTGRRRLIYDPSSALRDSFAIGKAESVEWQDVSGRKWRGRLYYPVGYRAERRYPFVLQTHGVAKPGTFSLYGTGFYAGPNYGVSAAQPLAARGIAVLQIEDLSDNALWGTEAEADAYVQGYEAAAKTWIERGLVDKDRVGITGFSRSGWHVSYTLTHSAFPFAAAVIADNMDTSYLQRLAGIAGHSDLDDLVGAPPRGPGLAKWLERAPGFNTDRITAPLQIQSHSFGVAQAPAGWEIFSHLRASKKPAELFFVADAEHGSHGLQNPRQSLSAQDRAIDWLDFWLTGHEDPAEEKRSLYGEWRKMRDAFLELKPRVRPPLLEWSSKPRSSSIK